MMINTFLQVLFLAFLTTNLTEINPITASNLFDKPFVRIQLSNHTNFVLNAVQVVWGGGTSTRPRQVGQRVEQSNLRRHDGLTFFKCFVCVQWAKHSQVCEKSALAIKTRGALLQRTSPASLVNASDKLQSIWTYIKQWRCLCSFFFFKSIQSYSLWRFFDWENLLFEE